MKKFEFLYPYEPETYVADGFAGHGIIADQCLFRLHHHIMSESHTRYKVSTIGLLPDSSNCGIKTEEQTLTTWLQFGLDGDLFETMVFREVVTSDGHIEMLHPALEMVRAVTSIEATEEHWKLIHKYLEK